MKSCNSQETRLTLRSSCAHSFFQPRKKLRSGLVGVKDNDSFSCLAQCLQTKHFGVSPQFDVATVDTKRRQTFQHIIIKTPAAPIKRRREALNMISEIIGSEAIRIILNYPSIRNESHA